MRTLAASQITHVVGIPDNTSGPLFDAIARHPTIRLIAVAREGEAFALAAGLWLGGASPLVVVQNTGLLEAGDSLRGTALRMGAPIPMLVTGRGYTKLAGADVSLGSRQTIELLTRADLDSAALFTEPTLNAWGIPFRRCEGEDDPLGAIASTIADAREQGRPAAVVMARELI